MAAEKYSLKAIKDIGKLSNDGFLAFDVAGKKILYCNKALTKIFGVTSARIMEGDIKALRNTLRDDDEFLDNAFNTLRTDAKLSNLELRVVAKDDRYISVDAYYIGTSEIIIAIVKDISRSKEHINYITEYGARKNTILDMVSHNLSGPLNLTNSLLDVVDQASKAQQYRRIEEPTRLIRENTQHCIDLINTFLREEHLTSPTIPVEANRYDAVAKCRIIVERYKQFSPAKQIKIISPKELYVTGDDVKYFQVVNNILSNAMKFTEESGKIVIEIRDEDDLFTTIVKDNGIGIPEYLQPHLFKKNTPASRPGLKGEKSIGMGLHIVKKLTDLMNGTITFDSDEGKGSTFTVVFPKH
jgi:two-component system, OmpR family, sensor histidine kinase VicK